MHRTGTVHDGWAVAIAWPETWCKRAGAWYDAVMRAVAVNRNGYYQVGHAALLVLRNGAEEPIYFDMGRYHAPGGTARVRSAVTDHELRVHTTCVWSGSKPRNLPSIMEELANNPACHGTGPLHWGATQVNTVAVIAKAQAMQYAGFHTYGPFAPGGSNCSRFVCTALLAGSTALRTRTGLLFPWTLSPTPLANVRACSRTGPSGIALPAESHSPALALV